MSGGVDSSVAAALLKRQGFEVIGITMCFNLPDIITKKPRCCGLQGIEDAKAVAEKLKVRHYVFNLKEALAEKVIADFCLQYQKGKTPNPCIRCNQYIKFDALLKKALAIDTQFLATGHYARIKKQANRYLLKKGKDLLKDQSYFIYRLGQDQLEHILFPLGALTKQEVRKLAEEFGLPVAKKKESQEICFLTDTDYRVFLKAQLGGKIKPGEVYDTAGNLLGRHQGIAFYTIGQREGLGIAKGYPLYVARIDPRYNRVILGSKEDVCKKEFLVGEPHFICRPLKKKIELRVKIRYNHQEQPAQLIPEAKKIRIRFKQAQFAITPGQSAVFYQKDTVVGGGIIERVLN